MFLLVGFPAAGKTTTAKELATSHRAVRFTPDEWMIPLFGEPEGDGKRDDLAGCRQIFQVPGADEIAGLELDDPPSGTLGWVDWARTRWPSLQAAAITSLFDT